MELGKLEMEGDQIDEYIAKFETLLDKAEIPHTKVVAIQKFKDGLRKGVLAKILQRDQWPTTINEWQQNALREVRRMGIVKESLGDNRGYQFSNQQAKWRSFSQQFKSGKKQDEAVPMEIDAAKFPRNPKREAEDDQLRKEGHCFKCKKQGHMKKDCPNWAKEPPEETPSEELQNVKQLAQTVHTLDDEETDELFQLIMEEQDLLGSPSQTVITRVLYLSHEKDNYMNALNMKMVMTTTKKNELALLDSGATENFIDPRTVEKLRLLVQKLQQARIIYNIDRTPNKAGSITHKCQLKLHFGEDSKDEDFFVTNLGQDWVVLGFPFLQQFNPTINWKDKSMVPANIVFITPKQIWEHQWKVWKQDHRVLPQSDILQKVSFAQQWAAIANKTKERLKEGGVPSKYRRHQKVFSKEGAKCLPPSREEDMTITFKDGAPEQLDCHVYPLSRRELEILRESLDEDLSKGFIKHGTSSFVSPIFFIPKKDGDELRMVIDYRKLNDITKKDFYPLLNLRTELEKLSHHQLFLKFDVRAGYNNIQIKEEDQYKAAFKTPLGTFIPTVMTFGFCNAPSIFQRAMNWDLEPLKQKYPNNFANYMDDVAIGTDNSSEGQELHEQIIHEFLNILKTHSYFLKVSKCEIEKDNMEFLGFLVGNGTV
jgi:Reverse transcriptase (RNA-dependent DNA polymerase)/Retroviral aspartyl protease